MNKGRQGFCHGTTCPSACRSVTRQRNTRGTQRKQASTQRGAAVRPPNSSVLVEPELISMALTEPPGFYHGLISFETEK